MRGTHPPDGALRDFALGRLGDPDDAAVESHLSECPDCLARATEPGPPDTLVELLAAAAARPDPTPAPADGELPTLTLAAGATPSQAPTHGFSGAGPGATPDGSNAPPAVLVRHPRYRPVRLLGVGGMGSVWLAEHAVMGRQVAVKVIRPELLARPLAAERFVREVRAAARLHHPNIVAAFDAEETAGACLLVMEFVPGEPLSEVVGGGPLPVADACRVARDAARGLAHAHAAGLVHRDVKPSNLIRTPDGITKVLDFGLVTDDDRPAGLTGDNVVMGTPDYIAPEQADDAHTADARADVYGLGCTLYHLLSGRVPFPGGSVLKKLDAHRTATADPLTGVPPALAAVVARMMARRPEDRIQTAAEVAEALEPFARGEVSEPPRPRRRVLAAVAAGVLAVVGLAVAAVAYEVRRGNEVITVETDDPDVEVTMRRNGDVIRIVDAKTKKTWELDAKNARLTADGGELTLDLPDGAPLVLRRNGAVVATIRRAPAAAPIPPAAAPTPAAPMADVRPYRVFAGHSKTVREVRFSPDGKTLYSGSFDGYVRAWDVDGGKERAAFDHGVRVVSIAVANGGKLLLSLAHADRPPFRLRAWDTTSGKEVDGFPEVPATEHLCTVAASPDGTTAATVALNGTVRVWDVAGRKLVRAFSAIESTPAYSVAWSPDGKLLAVTGNDGIAVCDAATGRRVHRVTDLGVHGQTTIAFTPDGGHVLTAGWEGIVRAYARGTWRLDRTLSTPVGRGLAGTHLTTAPDGRLLLAAHTAAVRVWDIAADRQLLRLVGDGLDSVTPVVSADGRRAAAGSDNGKVFVWELPPAAGPIPPAVGVEELHRIPFAYAGWLAVSPDGAEFLAFTAAGGKREAVIFDTATGKETGRCPMPAGELVYAWFIPGSRDLLVSDDLRLGRYDRATGAKRADLFEVPVNTSFAPLPAGGSAAAVWLRDAAGGYGRHRVVVRDLTTGAERFRVNPLHPGSVLGMAPRFSPDDKLLATTDTTPTASAIRLWDAATGKLVRTIDVAGALGCGNAFSADGTELVADYATAGGASVVGRWAVATGAPVRAAPVGPPWPYDFSEYLLGGRVLGYRGENGSAVRFVSTATGAAFADYRPGGAARGMAASADGRVMLFATDAGLRVVRVPTPPGP